MSSPTLQLTEEQVRNLPAVVDVTTAASVLGMGRTTAYELIRAGRWPTPVVRVGKLIRIPTSQLLDFMGLVR